MIEDISIKDFALIDTASVEFPSGFTVLSGETGAGKSILIGALSFLLGGKGGIEVIRNGASEARVSGTLVIAPHQCEAAKWLTDHSIEIENSRVLIRRMIRDNGKTAAWIQETQVTRAELSDFTSFFVDIHGQHEHQSLMRTSEHRRFLDSFAGIESDVEKFSTMYSLLVGKRAELQMLETNDSDRERKAELLSFALEEIQAARIQPDEDIILAAEESRLSQFEKLYEDIDGLYEITGTAQESVVSRMKKARSLAEHAAALDSSLSAISSRIDGVFYELSDIAEELRSYKDSLVFDPERLAEIQERTAFLYRLKKKYASSAQSPLSEVAVYAQKAEIQLNKLTSGAENRDALAKEISVLEHDVYRQAQSLSVKRIEASERLSLEVEKVLAELGMKATVFRASVTPKEGDTEWQKCGPYGFDNIEFLISANPGSPVKPLAKVASGGELSRIMLALKTILAESDTVDTLVFDEIDTGIGGEVSVAVGRHLSLLAQKKQILCITHLASIAVYADTQIKIEKAVDGGNTATNVFVISGEQRVREIARMLAGDAVSGASIEHARSLLQTYGTAG